MAKALFTAMDSWQTLRLELEREAEAIFARSGEAIVVAPDGESGSVLTLVARTRSLELTWLPEKNAVRWETEEEYSFERMPDEIASLARVLMWRLRR